MYFKRIDILLKYIKAFLFCLNQSCAFEDHLAYLRFVLLKARQNGETEFS